MNNLSETLEFSEKAYNIAPYDFKVLSNYGYILERLHQREKAELILSEALRINPYYEQAIINMVVLQYNLLNYKQALERIGKQDKTNKKQGVL